MTVQLYRPFETFNFSKNHCFLSGEKLNSPEEEISVFPLWLMQEYQLADKPFKMLDESIASYRDMKLPCSQATYINAIEPLEDLVRDAFLNGYEAVSKLPEIRLFQWIAKLVYGILFNEIRIGIKQQAAIGEAFNFSQSLVHKFSNLHIMLQSLIRSVEFDGTSPWTIKVVRIAAEQDLFNYRDEINTLTFSLSMKDFGIIACLQDNGANGLYNKETVDKVGTNPLHPVQFEELCGRFFYSNYLFNRLPEYTIMPVENVVFIEPMPLRGMSSKPLFDDWQNKVYGQVLENFWKPWGFVLYEIIKDPERPMSFLFDEQGNFRPADTVKLPFN